MEPTRRDARGLPLPAGRLLSVALFWALALLLAAPVPALGGFATTSEQTNGEQADDDLEPERDSGPVRWQHLLIPGGRLGPLPLPPWNPSFALPLRAGTSCPQAASALPGAGVRLHC